MNTVEYFKAKQELSAFLDNHSYLKVYQKELEELLKTQKTPNGRLVLLQSLMTAHVNAVFAKLEELKQILKKLK